MATGHLMSNCGIRRLSLAVLLLAATAAAGVALGQPDEAAEAARLVEVLGLKPGDTVADIGAGGGRMAVAVARQLGPTGRVYATEIDGRRLREIREAASAGGFENITILEAHATRTNLPAACCDAIYVRRVYHHFGDPAAMNASILASLRPGGRFAVIDFPPRRGGRRDVSPEDRASGDTHGVSPDATVDELRKAGFADVRIETREWPHGMFVVMARRP